MRLKYEPASEPLQTSVKQVFSNLKASASKSFSPEELKPLVSAQGKCWSEIRAVKFQYKGTSPIRSSTLPWDHNRALGIVLL